MSCSKYTFLVRFYNGFSVNAQLEEPLRPGGGWIYERSGFNLEYFEVDGERVAIASKPGVFVDSDLATFLVRNKEDFR